MTIDVRENFSDDSEFDIRYHATGLIQAETILQRTGDLPLVLGGEVGADATIVEASGVRDIQVALDLTPAAIEVAELGLSKAGGEAGSLSASITLADGAPIQVANLVVAAPSLDVRGGFQIQPDSLELEALTLEHFQLGESEGAMTVRRGIDRAYDIKLTARALDLDPFLNAVEGEPSADPPEPLRVAASVERLTWHGHQLRDFEADLTRDELGWRSMLMQARLPKGGRLTATLAAEEGGRRLHVTTDDAGDLFDVIDQTEQIAGGALDLDGIVHRQYPALDLEGTLRINDFTLLEAPILARLLTVASLTGIGNLLAGEGIDFDRFEMPFRYQDEVLWADRVHLSGSQLGLTMKGNYDTASEQIDISGTVVPVYGLNWAIGRIPILGDFLRGSEGEGAFAVTYSMTGDVDDPSVLVNPLSVITPGVIRELFSGIFSDESEAPRVGGETE